MLVVYVGLKARRKWNNPINDRHQTDNICKRYLKLLVILSDFYWPFQINKLQFSYKKKARFPPFFSRFLTTFNLY